MKRTTNSKKSNVKKIIKNPVAKSLRTPLFKSKVKPSGKIYNRKNNQS